MSRRILFGTFSYKYRLNGEKKHIENFPGYVYIAVRNHVFKQLEIQKKTLPFLEKLRNYSIDNEQQPEENVLWQEFFKAYQNSSTHNFRKTTKDFPASLLPGHDYHGDCRRTWYYPKNSSEPARKSGYSITNSLVTIFDFSYRYLVINQPSPENQEAILVKY